MISVAKPLKLAAGKAHDSFDSTRGLRSYRGPGLVDHPTPLRGRLGAQPTDRLFRLLLTAGAQCVEELGGGRILTKIELQSIGDAAVALDVPVATSLASPRTAKMSTTSSGTISAISCHRPCLDIRCSSSPNEGVATAEGGSVCYPLDPAGDGGECYAHPPPSAATGL
jgi:hypothetical protein